VSTAPDDTPTTAGPPAAAPTAPGATAAERVHRLPWRDLAAQLDDAGHAVGPRLLDAGECAAVAALFDRPRLFRSTVDMAQHRYGSGRYRYFAHPLPALVAELRAAFYPHLLPIARAWATRLGQPAPWPDDLDDWLARCHDAGQRRPTPLILSYGPGDWNALHRDLYGDLVFPLQVVIGLDEPGEDHTGGEFLMTEQRPRAQTRGYAAALHRGQVLVFTTKDRPVRSARGWSAAPMRHGVSTVRSGRRQTLGLLFHDAK
jgi:hypothetical protein